MSSEEEIKNQEENKFVKHIKEIINRRKEFLNWNLLFLIPWIFSLLYMFIWAPEKPSLPPELIPGIMNFGQFYTLAANPLEWSVFNFIMIWALLFAIVMLIENRERLIPAWLFVLVSFAIGMYGMMPYFALRSVWRKEPKTKKTLYTKIVDSRILGIIVGLLGLTLLLYGIIATSIIGGWSDFASNFIDVRLIQVMTVDFALFAVFYPIVIWDDMKRRNWKNTWLFIAFSIPIIGALVYVTARPRLPEGKITPSA
jgi:hypothetical protein